MRAASGCLLGSQAPIGSCLGQRSSFKRHSTILGKAANLIRSTDYPLVEDFAAQCSSAALGGADVGNIFPRRIEIKLPPRDVSFPAVYSVAVEIGTEVGWHTQKRTLFRRIPMPRPCVFVAVFLTAAALPTIRPAAAQKPRVLAETPPMGWNSWDSYAETVGEAD